MQTTSAISIAGQLNPGTTFGASTSMNTDAAIFTVAQNIMLTALTTGDSRERRLVAPRAMSAPGSTATNDPYSAETATVREPVRTPATTASSAPRHACAAMTRHGDKTGSRAC